jgi:mannitol-1-/sugar-/sorbitol-6-phosphatase
MTVSDSKDLNISVRAVLFDMDGVLISSIEADERSWLRWARLHGMEDTFSIHSTHGRRTVDTIHAIRPDLDLTTEAKRMEDFDAEDTEGLKVYPGVRELLSGLPPNQWSIVTSASDRIMRRRLGALNVPVPPRVVTSESVRLGKPNPDPYLLGASQLGFAPADCLVLEDAPSGIRAAKTAGCFVIAVASSHAPEELQEADWIVSSLEELAWETATDTGHLLWHSRQ